MSRRSAAGHCAFDKRGLERDDAVGGSRAARQPGELLNGDDVVAIGGAVRLHLGVVFEVIFAARQAERRLAGERRIDVRVLEIRIDVDVDRAWQNRA